MHAESCNDRVYPTRVDVVGVSSTSAAIARLCIRDTVRTSHDRSNCTLIRHSELTNNETVPMSEQILLNWDHPGSLGFHFARPVPINTVRVVYYVDYRVSELPRINVTSFPTIPRGRHANAGTYSSNTTREGGRDISVLVMTFDPPSDDIKEFHLKKVEFYSCGKFPIFLEIMCWCCGYGVQYHSIYGSIRDKQLVMHSTCTGRKRERGCSPGPC